MKQIKKEVIWVFYAILTLILGLLGYFISKTNKLEFGLAGVLIGVLISLILWIVWEAQIVIKKFLY